MNLTFLGGANEIGGSSLILTISNKRFLIDAGIRMNERSGEDRVPDFSQIGKIDAIFLTHAHTDHSGALPIANRYTQNAPIYMTYGTFQLCTVLFRDSIKLMQIVEKEIPRYDETEVINTFKNIKQVKFFHSIVLFDEIRVTFFPAGHILGASCIYFESNSGNILFTGDYSIANQIAVSGAMVNASPDIVVTESTYGGKSHIPRKELEYQCILKTKEVLERNGKILIPAFAIGRSQEMILLLKSAMSQKIIPEVNVFIDGMVNSVNVVYENNPSALPQNLQSMIKNKQSLFYTGFIKRVLHSEREKLVKRNTPSIFISSSGMLIGGPSVFYAKELLGDTKNALFISGYQDEESPGRRLLELKKEESLSLDNTKIAVQSEIFKFSFSAHADENQIISFVNSLSPDQIVLIHGDSGARDGLTNKFVCKNVHSPTIGSSIEFPEYKNTFFIIPQQTDNEELSLEQYWETCLHKGIKKISQRELEELFPNQMNEIEEFSGFRPDYLNTNFFSVITPEKRIEFIQRKKIYETIGNLEKKLVIYGEQNQFHLAFGVKQDDENMAFHLLSAKQGKPRTRIDAKKILHVFENSNGLDDISDEIQIIEKLRAMERMAAHKVKSYRQQLSFVEDGLTLEKAQHHLNIETPDIMDKIAILFALIPVAVKDDKGVWRFSSNKDSLQQMNISDTNLILDQIRNALTSYPLTKASYQNNSFVLQFDFPDAVNHSEILDKAQKSIPDPFTVSISDKINQAAFNPLLYEYLGKTGKVSLFMEEKKVVLKNIVKPLTKEFQEAFFRTTGFTVEEKLIPVPSMPTQTTTHKNQQEIISATQNCIPEHLLNSVKVGIRENVILLKADFPDVLMKTYPALLQTIESETGLKAEINSHPNSTALISLLKRKIDFRGNPSINTTEKTVKIEFISINEKIKHEIATETGFTVLKK